MQHDPSYEHWEERVVALEKMVDQHSFRIEDLEAEVKLLQEAVLELIGILRREGKDGMG